MNTIYLNKQPDTMKKIILVLIILISTHALFAQKNKRFEKIKAHKTAFITNRLDLSSNEAEQFWPVYNKYEKKLHQLEVIDRKKMIKGIVSKGGIINLSEKEAKDKLNELEKIQDAIHSTQKEKFGKISKILSAKKVLLLYKAEQDFKKELFKRLREKRGKKF
jgi:Spy/CpxP family protein refolding chaperone